MAENAAPCHPAPREKRVGRPRKYPNDPGSRLARKREVDRIGQRSSRQRTKDHIMMLENKMELLQADDKQSYILELLKTIEVLRQENEKLRNFGEKIRGLADEMGNASHNSVEDRGSQAVQSTTSTPLPGIGHTEVTANSDFGLSEACWDVGMSSARLALEISRGSSLLVAPDISISTSTPQLPDEIINYTFGDFISWSPPNSSLLWPVMMNPPESSYDHGRQISMSAPNEEKWRICNESLALGIKSARDAINEIDVTSTHAAFKAVLLGWDATEDIVRTHPMWVALQQVAEKIFGDWESKPQKIACMLILHRILMYYANPSEDALEKLPRFLRPRPSQALIQHPPAIDFMFWPGLRERLVFSYKSYMTTGLFSAYFCQYAHFRWPLPDNDILFFDQVTQEYRVSLLFERYAFDLNNWTLDEPFFNHFPECKDDVAMAVNSS